jgi:hypothetical protein
MRTISARISIDAPRETVHAFLCDLANRPAIIDHFADEFRLQRLESSGVGAAARFRVRRPRLWMETVIEEVEPPFRISEWGRAGRLGRIPTATVWELIESAAPGTCEATVTFWIEATHPVDRMREMLGAERRHRRNWTRALTRLRDVIENGRPVQRVQVAGADRLPIVA